MFSNSAKSSRTLLPSIFEWLLAVTNMVWIQSKVKLSTNKKNPTTPNLTHRHNAKSKIRNQKPQQSMALWDCTCGRKRFYFLVFAVFIFNVAFIYRGKFGQSMEECANGFCSTSKGSVATRADKTVSHVVHRHLDSFAKCMPSHVDLYNVMLMDGNFHLFAENEATQARMQVCIASILLG
jgi:hypothetical protein